MTLMTLPKVEEGIRTGAWNRDIAEGQNVRYISGTTLAEFDGRTYAISYEGVEILSADGSTVVRQATQVQGAEIKKGILTSSIGNIEDSGATHRFTATIEKDLAKNTQKQVLTEWTSSDTGTPLNWAGVLSEGGFDMRLPGESQRLVHDGGKTTQIIR